MAEDKPFDYVVRTAVDVVDKNGSPVLDDNGKPQTRWREIGVGFKGSNSITCLCDSTPVNGKFVIFPYEPRERQEKPKKALL